MALTGLNCLASLPACSKAPFTRCCATTFRLSTFQCSRAVPPWTLEAEGDSWHIPYGTQALAPSRVAKGPRKGGLPTCIPRLAFLGSQSLPYLTRSSVLSWGSAFRPYGAPATCFRALFQGHDAETGPTRSV